MKGKKYKLLAILMSAVFLLEPQAMALSKRGSTGGEVTQIQQKLINWGYLTGSADGVYGAKTEAAVKRFQQSNGLLQQQHHTAGKADYRRGARRDLRRAGRGRRGCVKPRQAFVLPQLNRRRDLPEWRVHGCR